MNETAIFPSVWLSYDLDLMGKTKDNEESQFSANEGLKNE